MSEDSSIPGGDEQIDTDSDRYPSFESVISAIQDHDEFQEGPVERLEITCLANGDATYRVWAPRAEEPTGGFFSELQ